MADLSKSDSQEHKAAATKPLEASRALPVVPKRPMTSASQSEAGSKRKEIPENLPEQYSAIYRVLEMMNEASATETEQPAQKKQKASATVMEKTDTSDAAGGAEGETHIATSAASLLQGDSSLSTQQVLESLTRANQPDIDKILDTADTKSAEVLMLLRGYVSNNSQFITKLLTVIENPDLIKKLLEEELPQLKASSSKAASAVKQALHCLTKKAMLRMFPGGAATEEFLKRVEMLTAMSGEKIDISDISKIASFSKTIAKISRETNMSFQPRFLSQTEQRTFSQRFNSNFESPSSGGGGRMYGTHSMGSGRMYGLPAEANGGMYGPPGMGSGNGPPGEGSGSMYGPQPWMNGQIIGGIRRRGVTDTYGNPVRRDQCRLCLQSGHYAWACPQNSQSYVRRGSSLPAIEDVKTSQSHN